MVDINKFIPAQAPCVTPKDCKSVDKSCMAGSCKVAVPYAFDATPWAHIPALTTDRYAFWITNPSMAMFSAVNLYCRKGRGVTAYVIESSYASIQVWRFDPYEYCPMVNGIRTCPPDTTATYRTLPGFIVGDFDANQVCTQRFNVMAPGMTYINEYNIAITILETTFVNMDVDRLRPLNASQARCVDLQWGVALVVWVWWWRGRRRRCLLAAARSLRRLEAGGMASGGALWRTRSRPVAGCQP